jgi:hypothetical protein
MLRGEKKIFYHPEIRGGGSGTSGGTAGAPAPSSVPRLESFVRIPLMLI